MKFINLNKTEIIFVKASKINSLGKQETVQNTRNERAGVNKDARDQNNNKI